MKYRVFIYILVACLLGLVACGGSTTRQQHRKTEQHQGAKAETTLLPTYGHGYKTAAITSSTYAIVLHWSGVSIASQTGYYIYKNGVQVADVTASPYTLQNLACDSSYTIQIKAHNGSGGVSAPLTLSYSTPTCFTPLRVVGNKLQNAFHQTVIFHGTDVSGPSYQCEQSGNDFSDTPTGDSLFAPMVSNGNGTLPKSWNINSVVFLLNQDCWLGINGVPAAYSGQNYINYVKSEVATMEKYGIYPVIVVGEGAPGTITPNWYAVDAGEATMPNNDHFPLLWEEIANTFKNDPRVIFRLYEEPFPNNSGVDLNTWKCWSQGDVQYSPSSVRTPPTPPVSVSSNSHCSENYGAAFSTVGMQSLLNIIRGSGANNIVQVPGVAFADMLSCDATQSPVTCGFLDTTDGIKVNDTLTTPQLMAVTDNYPDVGQYCGSVSCLDNSYAPVESIMPIVMGEAGTEGGGYSLMEQFVNWYDTHGQGYYGSQWEAWSSFITDYNGSPGAGWGAWFYSHVTGGSCSETSGC